MKRSTRIFILSICIMSLLCACSSSSNKAIIGYWMRGDGYTISFVDDTTCTLGEGAPQAYKIYDKNHLQIVDSTGNGVTEFVFEVEGETLKIRLASEDGYTEFTKNADEQKKILDEMRKWEALALEEQRKQEQINNIREQVSLYQNDIAEIQKDIDWNNSAIENNKEDIIKWNEAIEQEYIECQEAIDFGDDKEYQEKQRDDFIASHKESIQKCNERISLLEAENSGYQENIELILVEIEKLEMEIDELLGQK